MPTRKRKSHVAVACATWFCILIIGMSAGSVRSQDTLSSSPAKPFSSFDLTSRAFTGYGTSRGYGFGFGADVGVQFPFLFGTPAMVGVWGMHFLGTDFFDEDLQTDVNQQITFYGVQGGSTYYDDVVYVRGSGQMGAARIHHEIIGQDANIETKFMLSGGVMVGKRWGDFVLAVEPVLPLIFGSDYSGAGFSVFLNFLYAKSI